MKRKNILLSIAIMTIAVVAFVFNGSNTHQTINHNDQMAYHIYKVDFDGKYEINTQDTLRTKSKKEVSSKNTKSKSNNLGTAPNSSKTTKKETSKKNKSSNLSESPKSQKKSTHKGVSKKSNSEKSKVGTSSKDKKDSSTKKGLSTKGGGGK